MQLDDFRERAFVPYSLVQFNPENNFQDFRYNSSLKWIDENNHAVISNGPFYLDRYSPDSRMIVIKSFDYGDYLFEQGKWKHFEHIKSPSINSIEFVEPYVLGSNKDIQISTENASEIHYFVVNSEGTIILNGIEKIVDDNVSITLDSKLDVTQGVNTIKIFAASDEVLKPFEYSKSFLVVLDKDTIPDSELIQNFEEIENDYWYILLVIPILIILIILIIKKLFNLT